MDHIIVHDKIVNGVFVPGKEEELVVVKYAKIEDVLKYYSETLKAPCTKKIIAHRKKLLENQKSAIQEVERNLEAFPQEQVLTQEAFNLIGKLGIGKSVEASTEMGLFGINWSCVYFYEHVNYQGRKFSLCLGSRPYNYDLNLHDNNFGDLISSVDTGWLVVCTILCEHINFGGRRFLFFSDKANLVNHNFNDITSSVAIAGFGFDFLWNIMKAIVPGLL
jgi:hypothetical protein